jgi:hypothetical protein
MKRQDSIGQVENEIHFHPEHAAQAESARFQNDC